MREMLRDNSSQRPLGVYVGIGHRVKIHTRARRVRFVLNAHALGKEGQGNRPRRRAKLAKQRKTPPGPRSGGRREFGLWLGACHVSL